jgi:hypothetical protein
MSNINSFIIRAVDGSIDHEASIGAFAGALLKYEAERETEMAVIAGAVNALFDQYKGARLNTPFLVGETLRRLNAQPENYKVLTEKVQQFVRTSPAFTIGKGKGGGVARLRDLPTE